MAKFPANLVKVDRTRSANRMSSSICVIFRRKAASIRQHKSRRMMVCASNLRFSIQVALRIHPHRICVCLTDDFAFKTGRQVVHKFQSEKQQQTLNISARNLSFFLHTILTYSLKPRKRKKNQKHKIKSARCITLHPVLI